MAAHTGWRRKLAFLPSVLAVLLIAGESTQTFSIENTSQWIAPFWFRHFAWLPMQRFWEFNEALRKGGHLVGYGLVCLAFFAAWMPWLSRRSSVRLPSPSSKNHWNFKNRVAGLALISTLLLGAADELHQSYVPQRTSTMTDVGFDVCGGYFALMVFFAVLRLREQKIGSPSTAKPLEQAIG
jgi:hypothetical protein